MHLYPSVSLLLTHFSLLLRDIHTFRYIKVPQHYSNPYLWLCVIHSDNPLTQWTVTDFDGWISSSFHEKGKRSHLSVSRRGTGLQIE
jgi:hypothetical protein